MITLTPVESSLLTAIGYDAITQTLRIEFPRKGQPAGSGSVYADYNFPPEEWAKFSTAESFGKWFLANIKNNPKYPYKRIEPDPVPMPTQQGEPQL